MKKLKSFIFWNNKGGVGKTTLTWLAACHYAHQNPQKKIILVDMCPQANLSEIALGGNGDGENNLETLIIKQRTISDYISNRLRSPFDTFAQAQTKMTNYQAYLQNISEYNKNFPPLTNNIFLIPGNSDLDFQSKAIEFFANSGETLNQPETWKIIKNWIKDLLLVINDNQEDAVFFIDCNPSFAPYTEMAIIAGTDLIVPCTADGASARALSNLMKLIYDISPPSSNINIPSFFAKKIQQFQMELPKISLIIQNRNRRRPDKVNSDIKGQGVQAKAHQSVMDEISNKTNTYLHQNPHVFSRQTNFVIEVKDCNSLGTIISYNGFPLSIITPGEYEVYGQKIRAEKNQIDMITSGIKNLVGNI